MSCRETSAGPQEPMDSRLETPRLAMQVLLAHCPEHALELRHASPSHAWIAACRRCRGPEILFAFFEGLSEETPADSAALGHLLRKFQSQGSQVITRGGRVLDRKSVV